MTGGWRILALSRWTRVPDTGGFLLVFPWDKNITEVNCKAGDKGLRGSIRNARNPSVSLYVQRPAPVKAILQRRFESFPHNARYIESLSPPAKWYGLKRRTRSQRNWYQRIAMVLQCYSVPCWSGERLVLLTDWSRPCKESWGGRHRCRFLF